MASRMSRYAQKETKARSRSAQNKDLYRRIYDDIDYDNVEGIVTAFEDSDVNPDRIKELISRRESQRNRQIVRRDVEQRPLREFNYEDRNYDIRDVLNQAKTERPSEPTKKYRNLSNYGKQYDDIVLEKKEDFKKQEDELRNLIETVTNATIIDNNNDFGLDLLEDLRSNTMIGDSKSIRAIVNEEVSKEIEKTLSEKAKEVLLDQSFITNGMKLKKEEFNELDQVNKTIQKNNSLMITIIVFIVSAIIIFCAVGLIMTFAQ